MKWILASVVIGLIYIQCSSTSYATTVKAKETQNKLDLSKVEYMNSETLPDSKLEQAFSKAYDLEKGKDQITYYYNRIDLNDDQVPETFVFLVGPYVCGTGGCSGLIFTQDYDLISKFSLVRNPVIIRKKKTNGWKNIVMYVAGGGMEPRYKELKFNGNAYPLNPSIQPDVQDKQIEGIGIINDELGGNSGIKY
ncbi:hypothetical protein [Pontibacillus sp. HMF3514]|uniref:hypothetical protein n=1 Tax=Pontibacillus sp. HMF3514 TaxID=2692425 RepID=UPI0013202450|nr:hypothetical protein [Pontibacillus sp. HMF3514]QHE50745.1 hypothetical protein GS400_01145 [Pontibacillus sp. HMF3514]